MRDGPARGGTRGGADQFNWDDVKSDKDREFYLGHSVKASVGRWQNGKDILWYTRGKGDEESAAAEIAAIKAAEEGAMAEALGLKPKSRDNENGHGHHNRKLDPREMDQLLRRGAGGAGGDEGTRTRGIGGQEGVSGGPGTDDHEVMAGLGMDNRDREILRNARGDDTAGVGVGAMTEREKQKLIKKASKRKRKDEKKSAKRAKKEAKKAKKDAKKKGSPERRNDGNDRALRSRSRSDDSDSSSSSGSR